ncbi:phosphatidate cytidylyltransferase [uncultured Porticoccus sp.]|uniref:phosphatidate cytidylyltransferase n=1 Tax=uncultured Porticoccus sp. TaxID=1256050 RepID=UPI00261E3DCE|nr:phosphatidate cytidylyltransferase [uncultured Porticoccus sp.]
MSIIAGNDVLASGKPGQRVVDDMLRQRIITGIAIAVVFFVALFLLGPTGFSLAIACLVGFGAWEWSNLSGFSSLLQRVSYLCIVLIVLLLSATLIDFPSVAALDFNAGQAILAYTVPWWAIALLWVQGYPSSAILWGSRWMRAIMGLLVLVPTWVAAVMLIHLEQGPWLVSLVVVLVATADIGAYFSGRRFGRRYLSPHVSPKKTWEGLFGGVLANLPIVIALGFGFGLDLRHWLLLGFTVLATVLSSVLGDLLESMVKRHRGIKDSGNILPGHGGLLDRIDSLTAALPVFALITASSNGWF